MASTFEVNIEDVEPMSRTYQYRKVMKPMLERKRRARINKCLDELKDLMVGALQSEGETITKLEKADVLELTVRHLRKLKQHQALAIPSQNHAQEKFRAGFAHCANEVTRFVNSVPGVDLRVSHRLLNHLGSCMGQISAPTVPPMQATSSVVPQPNQIAPITVTVPKVYTPPASPESTSSQVSPQPNIAHQMHISTAIPSPSTAMVSPPPSMLTPPPSASSSPVRSIVPPEVSPSLQKPQQNIRVPVPNSSPVWRPW